MKREVIIFIIVLVLLECFAQYCLQKNVEYKTDFTIFLVLGIISYSIIAYIYYKILSSGEKLANANIYWNVSTIAIVTLMGVFLFKQKITVKEIIGILIAITGVVIVSYN